MFLQITNFVSTFILSGILFSVIVFVIIWPVQKYLFKNDFRWQYAVWTLFLIRLVLPFNMGLPFNPLQLVSDMILKQTNLEFFTDKNEPVFFMGIQQMEGHTSNILPESDQKKELLFYFWLFGSFCLMTIFIFRRKKYKKQLKILPQNDSYEIEKLKIKWKDIFKIRREIHLRIGSKGTIPFTMGIIKPVIVIPHNKVSANSIKNLEVIIAHEMAHIKRFDDLRLILLGILQSLYFFNPLVWFTVKKLCSIQEICCDHDVMQAKEISGRDYGLALLNIADRQNYWGLIYLTAMADFKKNLTKRLIYIKGENNMFNRKNPAIYFTLLITATILVSMSFPDLQPHNFLSEKPLSTMRSDPDFQKPLDKIEITSNFGNQRHPIDKIIRHHDGIDLHAKKGANVYAAETGLVLDAQFRESYGKVISIQHKNGYTTLYSHLSDIKVKKGQRVKKGEIIGLAGNTGVSTGPHLHFEIRKDDEPVNPQDLINFK